MENAINHEAINQINSKILDNIKQLYICTINNQKNKQNGRTNYL